MPSARPHIEAAGARAPAILFNGARVQSLGGPVHHDVPLPSDAALAIIELCREHGVFMNCYHGDTISIEQACETAQSHGTYRVRTIRALLKRQGDEQEQFEFMQEHPIIRSVSEYGKLVHAQLSKE